MVLPSDITIKHEKEDYEHDAGGYLSPEFEVTVNIEVESSHVSQWDVKTEFPSNESSDSSAESFEILDIVRDKHCFCNESRVDYEDLIEYMRVKCSFCDKKFFERYSLLRHNLKHLKLELKPIDNQTKTTTQKTERTIRTVENKDIKATKNIHECEVCGKKYNYKNWHAHIREVHRNKSFKCNFCDSSFQCARYLRRHVYAKHTDKTLTNRNKDVTCTLCPAILAGKSALTNHMKNCHGDEAQCKICKSVLKSAVYLRTHMKRVHYDDGKEHKCVCGKTFKSQRYLRVHMKNTKHSGPR